MIIIITKIAIIILNYQTLIPIDVYANGPYWAGSDRALNDQVYMPSSNRVAHN